MPDPTQQQRAPETWSLWDCPDCGETSFERCMCGHNHGGYWIEVVPASTLQATEEYAREGWAWLDEALDALGVKDVFGIKNARSTLQAAEAQRDALLGGLKQLIAKVESHNQNVLAQDFLEQRAVLRAALDEARSLLSTQEPTR